MKPGTTMLGLVALSVTTFASSGGTELEQIGSGGVSIPPVPVALSMQSTQRALRFAATPGASSAEVDPGDRDQLQDPAFEVPRVVSMRTTAPLEDCLTHKMGLLDAAFRTSPDGQRVLMFLRANEDRWWWTVLGADGSPLEVLDDPYLGEFWPYNTTSPIWGPGGYVIAVDQRLVMRINPANHHGGNLNPSKLLQLPEYGALLAPAADGTGFYLLSQDSRQVWRVSLDGRDKREVGELEGRRFSWMDASPSGAYLAVASPAYPPEPGPYGVGSIVVVSASALGHCGQLEAVDRCVWHPVRDALLYERGGFLWEVAAPRWLPRRLLMSCRNAAASLDGRWVAYEMPGQEGIWVRGYEQEGVGTRIADFGSSPFWLAGNRLGLRRLTERGTLEHGAVREAAITVLQLAFPDAG